MTGNTVEIDNGVLGIDVTIDDGEATLSGLRHRPTGATFVGGGPLWELEFRNAAGYAATVDGGDAARVELDREADAEGTTATLRWSDVPVEFPDTGRHGSVAVTLRIRLPDSEDAASFRPRVTIDAGDCTLWNAVFPALEDLRRAGADRRDDRLLLPDGFGAYVRNPTATDRLRSWDDEAYPSGSTTMQFVALENGGTGVYLGLHDPEGRPKHVGVDSPDGERTLPVRIEHSPAGAGTEQSTFDPGYDAVLGCYEGDWYEAATRYREWALAEAAWTETGPVATREAIPDWFLETCLWWAPGFDAVAPWNDDIEQSRSPSDLRETVDLIADLADRVPAPTACHWYGWHRIPFDTSYPDYAPAREGFSAAVADLQAAGVRVMPYVNARLADPNSDAWAERDLEAAAAKPASARLDPAAEMPTYEEYGNGQLLSPMCAATETWRDTVAGLATWLEDDLGVDAVYLDQIAAAEPPACFDPDHDHPAGGGGYAVDAYRSLLGDLAETTELALTTECNAEPYLDGVSGYLLWHSARSESVPLFQAVYGDYAVTFGRHFVADDLEDGAAPFRAKLAQLFDYGTQLGWLPLSVAGALLEPEFEPALEYLARTAAALSAGREYLLAGRRLPDLEPRTDVPAESVSWIVHHRQRWDVELPTVLASAWRAPEGAAVSGVAVAVTNWTDEERSAAWTLGDEHRPTSEGAISLDTLGPDGGVVADVRSSDGSAVLAVTAPPRTSAVLRLVGPT